MSTAVILMGVSGCGKTTIGKALSEELNWPFYDGDDFHTSANIEKMSRGIPLDDVDRKPWLEELYQLILEHISSGRSLIVASSALKRSYRQILRGDLEDVLFVYLEGNYDLIASRIQNRDEHFMKTELLRTQFDTLEEPEDAVVVSIEKTIPQIVDSISNYLKSEGRI